MCNLRNEAMTNPFQRIALALSYIKGPCVDDWVAKTSDDTVRKVFGDPQAIPPIQPIYADNDENLWNEFVNDFAQAFADTAAAEQAYADLSKLEMKGDEIDEYIATFEHLLARAGWDRAAHRSIEMFKQGLQKGIHAGILQKDPLPIGIDQWQAAARKEVQRRRLIFASLGPRGGDYLSTRQNRQREKITNRVVRRDPDAMDIDTTVVGEGSNSTNWRERCGISEDERKKRQQEGRCFQCGRQGHMRRNCPRKGANNGRKDGRGGRNRQGENTRATITEGDQQEEVKPDNGHAPIPPPYVQNDLINNIRSLNIEERDELMDWMMDEPGF